MQKKMMSEYDLSIVLPCYNESENLPEIFMKVSEILKGTSSVEVVFVNNGSTDSSAKVFSELMNNYHMTAARIENVEKNIGYGYGILTGVRTARGEVIAWTHADLQTDLEDVITIYKEVKNDLIEKKCIVKGRRRNRKLLDVFFTFGMSVIASVLLKKKLSDINAQPKMFHRSFLAFLENAPLDFSLDLYLLYKAKTEGFEILSKPVFFHKRLHGEAKGGGGSLKGKMRVVNRTLLYIKKLRNEIKGGER